MRYCRTALTIVVLLSLCAFAGAEDTAKTKSDKAKTSKKKAVKVDLTSPKKAALTFAQGLEGGDKAAVRAATIGSNEDYKLLDLLASVVAAGKDLNEAAVEKFGEEGKKVGQQQESITDKVETANEEITGDTATLDDGTGQPLKLKKDGDDWKIDLASMPNREQMAQAIPIMTTIRKAMNEVATEIRDGKYETADQAQQAMGMKMAGALGAPGGAPPPEGDEAAPETDDDAEGASGAEADTATEDDAAAEDAGEDAE